MILVTGASGFVGRHVVTALGRRFPATPIRIFDAKPTLDDPPDGVQAIYGLIEEPNLLPDVVAGVEVVIHLAAKVQPDARNSKELWQVNVEGTRNIYAAAAASGCKLFLHMSSAGVYGPPRRPDPFNEDDTPCPVTPYQRTKWGAEEALRQIDAPDTTLNILRPAGIYGPGSHLEIPQYRRLRNQRWVVEIGGGVIAHPTYIDDVVQAILGMVAMPAPHGTILNIGGECPIQLQDLQALLAEVLGVSRHRLVLPSWFARPLCVFAEPILALKGRPNPLLRAMSRGKLFSAAVDDRRFRQRYPDVPVASLRDGLRESIEWAITHRLL